MALAREEALALAGMMGSGKSTVTLLLAQALGRRSLSTDAELVRRFGKPVPAIFAEHGEAAFRREERALVAGIVGPLVVDLGGGAFCDPASAERLLGVARVVFLDVSAREAARRIGSQGAAGSRPLSASWTALLARRLPLYRRAHVVARVDGLSPEAVARRILDLL